MVNEKVIAIATQTAITHIGDLMASVSSSNGKPTVYWTILQKIREECNISPEEFEQRIRAHVERDTPILDVSSQVGNLLKNADNTNMGQKIFKQLVNALFSPHAPITLYKNKDNAADQA